MDLILHHIYNIMVYIILILMILNLSLVLLILYYIIQYKQLIGTIARVLYNFVAGNIFHENLIAS